MKENVQNPTNKSDKNGATGSDHSRNKCLKERNRYRIMEDQRGIRITSFILRPKYSDRIYKSNITTEESYKETKKKYGTKGAEFIVSSPVCEGLKDKECFYR